MPLSLLLARRLLLRAQGGFAGFIIRLAILATGLGVAVMVLALVFIAGFKQVIEDKLHAFWSEVLIVPATTSLASVAPSDAVPQDALLMRAAAAQPGVAAVSPFVLQSVIIQANGQMEGVRMKGSPASYRPPTVMRLDGSSIQYPDSGYARDVILSKTTANRLSLAVGDSLLLYYVSEFSQAPRARKLRLSGTYHTGLEEVDRQFALCDMRLLQRLADWEADEITGYQVQLRDRSDTKHVTAALDACCIRRPLKAYPLREVYEGLFAWLAMQDVNGVVLLLIVAIVAIINLTASLILLLADRTPMIAVLKTLGMQPAGLRGAFVWLGGLVGLGGVALGLIIGLGFGLAQQRFGFLKLPEATYYMTQVPVRFEWMPLLAVAIGMPLLCLLCMSLPALYIRRIRPARVLNRA